MINRFKVIAGRWTLTDVKQLPVFEYWYQAEVKSVHDGDSITVDIDMGRRIHIIDAVRLYRINAPELSQAGGKDARDFLRGLLPAGTIVRLQTFRNKADKYGRWLADVYLEQNDGEFICVNDHMVSTGHAVFYDGGAK